MEQQDKLDQLIAENQELLALTKQAFVKREVEKESVPVDEEWEKFAAEHADELEALDNKAAANYSLFTFHSSLHKVAASIIGILFTVGVAFAAIHIVRMVSNPKPQAIQTEQTISAKPTSALPTCQANIGIADRYRQDRHDNHNKAHCFRQCRIG